MTKRKDSDTVSLTDDPRITGILYGTCRASGWLFATTERDVEEEERRQATESLDMPNDLRDPHNIGQRAHRVAKGKKLAPVIDQIIKDNLARAARGGSGISKEIEERMHRDRENAEKESGL